MQSSPRRAVAVLRRTDVLRDERCRIVARSPADDSARDRRRMEEAVISEDQKQSLVGLWLLKKLDLKPEDGGMTLPVVLPADLSPLDETLQQLAVDGYVEIEKKKGRYKLTKQGIAYLGNVIDEAQQMVDELDELDNDD